jgi:K+-sensing histidine kinase KdpD
LLIVIKGKVRQRKVHITCKTKLNSFLTSKSGEKEVYIIKKLKRRKESVYWITYSHPGELEKAYGIEANNMTKCLKVSVIALFGSMVAVAFPNLFMPKCIKMIFFIF